MDNEFFLRRKKKKSKRVCITIWFSLICTLVVAVLFFSWYSRISNTTTDATVRHAIEKKFIVEVDNNTISFELTMRLHVKDEESKIRRRRSVDCDNAKLKLKEACNNTSDFKSCQMDLLQAYLEGYISSNLIEELKSSSHNDSLGRFKLAALEIDLFNCKSVLIHIKAKIRLIFESGLFDNETESGIKVEPIMATFENSFDRCENHLQVSNIKLGDGAYIAHRQYEMVKGFIGDWKLTRSENFEEVLEKLGLNYFLRKIVAAAKVYSKTEYDENTNKWTLTRSISALSMKTVFVIDEEFDEAPNGTKLKTIVQVQNNMFIHTQRDLDGNVFCVTKRVLISDDEHWELVEASNITAKRVLHRI